MDESRFVQVAPLEKQIEDRFLQATSPQCRAKQPAVHRHAVRDSCAAEMGRQRDVLRYVDRVKVNDVGSPCQNVFGQGLFEISRKEPLPERVCTPCAHRPFDCAEPTRHRAEDMHRGSSLVKTATDSPFSACARARQ